MFIRYRLLSKLVALWKNNELLQKIDRLPYEMYPRNQKPKGRCCIHKERAVIKYKMMAMMGVKTVYNHADFRLMSKRAVKQFSLYKESNMFLRGLMPLIGYQTAEVYYDRKERVAGESKYPLKKMLALAFNGISSFSVKPITMIMWLGVIIIVASLLASVYALISYFVGSVVPGWTSLMVSVWLLGGLQLLAIGMVGMYIGKIYMEVKERPRYNIEKVLESEK